jgi:threonine/homoserine/homoserine lactone efflux protein
MWLIFSFSFVVALTGAMAPGPLLTYTIIRTLDRKKRGYLVGAAVITGHALLEAAVVILLLLGFAPLLQNKTVVAVIGIVGGLCLLLMGGMVFKDVLLKRVRLESTEEDKARAGRLFASPILGGLLVSMSNPYWWIWWATVGFAFMLRYQLSFAEPVPLLIFFLGHEAGDLAWYAAVSATVHFGRRWLTEKLYRILLSVCAAAMIGFGLYLGISTVL